MMKNKIVTVIAATALLGMAACSSTRTQRAPGEQVDDAALLTSVKSALASDPITESGEINVDVNRGIVKLSGFVDSSKEQAQAVQVARSVKGVKEVKNDIAVQTKNESTGDAIDDSVLTAKVKTALITSPETKAHQINVETKQGVVQMSGFVDTAAAKAAATTVAKSVTGVKGVKNELSVKSY
jgi:hyperosmotically inducible protein